MQREYTRVYPGSGKEGPTSSGGREYCIFLHRSACVGATSYERGSRSQVSKKRRKSGSVAYDHDALRGEPSASSFIGSSGGRGVQKTLSRCLGGEGSAGTVEVAIATCLINGQPSPGCRGDVDPGVSW
jgi:hypothetical protein